MINFLFRQDIIYIFDKRRSTNNLFIESFSWSEVYYNMTITQYIMVSVLEWPDLNTREVARAVRKARETQAEGE